MARFFVMGRRNLRRYVSGEHRWYVHAVTHGGDAKTIQLEQRGKTNVGLAGSASVCFLPIYKVEEFDRIQRQYPSKYFILVGPRSQYYGSIAPLNAWDGDFRSRGAINVESDNPEAQIAFCDEEESPRAPPAAPGSQAKARAEMGWVANMIAKWWG